MQTFFPELISGDAYSPQLYGVCHAEHAWVLAKDAKAPTGVHRSLYRIDNIDRQTGYVDSVVGVRTSIYPEWRSRCSMRSFLLSRPSHIIVWRQIEPENWSSNVHSTSMGDLRLLRAMRRDQSASLPIIYEPV